MKITKKISYLFTIGMVGLSLTACGGNAKNAENEQAKLDLNSMTVEEITTKAKEEGEVNSVGMPDSWANWKET